MLVVVAIDWLVVAGGMFLPQVSLAILKLLLAPPLGFVLPLLFMGAIGALAVWILERGFSRVVITTNVLWALVPCLILASVLKDLLPITFRGLSQWVEVLQVQPSALLSLLGERLQNSVQLESVIAMTVGIFTKGQRYWR